MLLTESGTTARDVPSRQAPTEGHGRLVFRFIWSRATGDVSTFSFYGLTGAYLTGVTGGTGESKGTTYAAFLPSVVLTKGRHALAPS